MAELKDIIEKLERNIDLEKKAIEEDNWKLVDKLVSDNEKWIKKIMHHNFTSEEEKKMIESIALKIKETEQILNKKIDKIRKGIAGLQNTQSNLDNLFTKTDQPSYFIDEEK